MLVPVRVAGASAAEWSVVELQGDLVADGAAASASATADALAGVAIGTLRFVDGVATLRVGNHVLAGKLAALPKPLAILQKVGGAGAPRVAGGESTARRPQEGGDDQERSGAAAYEVVGIARSRVVFSSRPKPVLVE